MSRRWALVILVLGVLVLAGEASARSVGTASTMGSRG
jgi:hypothetical protein